MKGIIKRLFNKRTTKQKPLGQIVVGVEIENRLELQELTQECCEAIEHLNNCIDKLNNFELKASTSIIKWLKFQLEKNETNFTIPVNGER